MRRSVAAFLIVLMAAPLAASAKSPREDLQKLLSKVAPSDLAKAKTACICFDAGGAAKRAGVLTQRVSGNQVFVDCQVDAYDSAGNVVGGFSCSDYEVAR